MENNEYTEALVENHSHPSGEGVEASFRHMETRQSVDNPATPTPEYQEQLRLKEMEARLLREQLELYKAAASNPSPHYTGRAHTYADDLEDEGFVPVSHYKKLVEEQQRIKQELHALSQRQQEEKVVQKYPDLPNRIGELQGILAKDPELLQAFKEIQAPGARAHFAAAILKAHSPSKPPLNEEAQRMVKNAKQAGSLASMGSAPGGAQPDFTKMSKADFWKYVRAQQND